MTDPLLSALEAATEGSRELSDRMLLACGWTREFIGKMNEPPWTEIWVWRDCAGNHVRSDVRPSPTESIDDALNLVGGEWDWSLSYNANDKGPFEMCFDSRPMSFDNRILVYAKTPALAACICILKAALAGKE